MQSAYGIWYCHPWPVRLHHIFSHYNTRDTIFGKRLAFFRKSAAKIKISLKSDTNNWYFNDVFTFMTISLWIIFKIRNVSDKTCKKKSKHAFYVPKNIFLSRKPWRLRDNLEKYGGARGYTNDVTIQGVRVACWISKTTCTQAHEHSHALGHTH